MIYVKMVYHVMPEAFLPSLHGLFTWEHYSAVQSAMSYLCEKAQTSVTVARGGQ
jgi:hypothetical protein